MVLEPAERFFQTRQFQRVNAELLALQKAPPSLIALFPWNVQLVNVVRKPAQVALLQGLGAQHIVDMSEDGATAALTDALVATDATIAFDATGGGKLTDQLLTAMEQAQMRKDGAFNRYGSATHKQSTFTVGLSVRQPH